MISARERAVSSEMHAAEYADVRNIRAMLVHRWGAMMAGGEIWVMSLARHLQSAQTQVDVLVGLDGPLLSALPETGVTSRHVAISELRSGSLPALAASALSTLRSAFALAGHAISTSADVIHASSLECAVSTCIASRLSGAPLVITVMNCGPYPKLDIWFARRAEAVIAISSAVRTDLVAAGVPDQRIHLIASGIEDTSPHVPANIRQRLRERLDIPQEAPVIGMVATLERKKAQDVLLSAFPAILASVPGSYVVLFGADHESDGSRFGPYEAELREQAARLGIADNVRFAGYHPDARQLVSGFDIAVLCSRKEGLGFAAIEAMAAGTPIIATSAEGLREVITHEETGLLVPPDDHVALADQVVRLLQDRDYARALAENARASVRARFDARLLAARNRQVYDRVLDQSRNSRNRSGLRRLRGFMAVVAIRNKS